MVGLALGVVDNVYSLRGLAVPWMCKYGYEKREVDCRI